MASKREQLRKEMAKEKPKGDSKGSNVFLWGSLIAVIALIVIVAAVAIAASVRNAPDSPNAVGTKPLVEPTFVDNHGAFQLDENGVAREKVADEPDKIRAELFFDPICPGCGSFDRILGETILEKAKSGEISLLLNVVPFMDKNSLDNYSTRAANALLTIAEESPEHAYAYMSEMFKIENQPGEAAAYVPVTNETLIQWALNVGVSEEDANKILEDRYSTWLLQHVQENFDRPMFAESFSTPTLLVGGTVVDGEVEDGKKVEFVNGEDMEVTLERYLNEAK